MSELSSAYFLWKSLIFVPGNIMKFLCVSLRGPNFSNMFKLLKAGRRFSWTDVLLYLITTYDALAEWWKYAWYT